MRFTRLVARGFRNLEPFDLPLDAPFVVLHGENAQGKTNTLEALWYATTLRPLRGHRPAELLGWDAPLMEVAVWSDRDGIVRHRRVQLEGGQRGLTLDGKRCNDLSAWFEDLRAIAFTPADGEVIMGGPELRRRWVDRAAFTARPAHLDIVRAYQRALVNKAATLRADRPDPTVLDVLDEQLASLGARLTARRADLLAELAPHVRQMVSTLAGQPSDVTLALRTAARGTSVDERAAALREAFGAARRAELRRRRTLVGPQIDDVVVRLQGQLARRYASRGQVRTLVLALKLAELVAARERGVVPVFLLDDLSSELDRARTGRLVGLLGDLGAQVVVTTTDPEHVTGDRRADAVWVEVRDGRLVTG
ncbi:MAG: DNA replication and repair protein RecF [Alphaproteobacteria bacterium]|nr:DNA replication and repair protein RecF [Alphaproteobacteria bacterium]MCB9693243.1 DNA replication and repair protein RecF [Alphaproteobacteria bacterium]